MYCWHFAWEIQRETGSLNPSYLGFVFNRFGGWSKRSWQMARHTFFSTVCASTWVGKSESASSWVLQKRANCHLCIILWHIRSKVSSVGEALRPLSLMLTHFCSYFNNVPLIALAQCTFLHHNNSAKKWNAALWLNTDKPNRQHRMEMAVSQVSITFFVKYFQRMEGDIIH